MGEDRAWRMFLEGKEFYWERGRKKSKNKNDTGVMLA